MKKLVFFSNYLNHHQVPLADAFYDILGDDYAFVATMPVEAEHLKGGKDYSSRKYCVVASKNAASRLYAMELAISAEVCVFGANSLEYAIERAKQSDSGLSFEFSERWLKRGWINILSPHLSKWWLTYQRYFKNKSFYKLNASAFAAKDHLKLHTYQGRCYKWGYFTAVPDNVAQGNKRLEKYEVEASQDVSTSRIAPTIMWCARFLKLKHPELPVMMAEELRRKGYDFQLDFYGSGDEEEPTKALVERKGLGDVIKFHGALPNAEVLKAMYQHDIFLFTSDSNEGWGAVANESMSQGCVLVGSDAIGSIPFLLDHKKNGMIFKSCNVDSLTEQMEWLLNHPQEMKKMQQAAMNTMQNVWSPKNAAHNFLQLVDDLENKRECSVLEGPGAKD